MKATLYRGDCLDVLAAMEPESVDAIVCDPPYGLGFMNSKWDALPPGVDWARLCLRVLKPGGHLVAFGGTRTVHRLATAIEDAQFEIRDMVSWLYWSGFPKSKNVALSIDKGEGHPNRGRAIPTASTYQASDTEQAHKLTSNPVGPYEPRSEAAKKWNGYGTALKPAQEPAVLARKPLTGTVAGNVLEHGTGALNIDGCRFAYGDPAWPGPGDDHTHEWERHQSTSAAAVSIVGQKDIDLRGYTPAAGRWPANIYAHPKASRSEREAGCERLPGRTGAEATDRTAGSAGLDNPRAGAGRTADRVKNHHPTVKPIGVMRWLCKLTGGQPGSVILDPFMGSGTTGCAAVLEGFDFIGIEREPEYMQICEARIRHHMGALFAHGVQVIETDKAAK
jgi:DNA modification methylase